MAYVLLSEPPTNILDMMVFSAPCTFQSTQQELGRSVEVWYDLLSTAAYQNHAIFAPQANYCTAGHNLGLGVWYNPSAHFWQYK